MYTCLDSIEKQKYLPNEYCFDLYKPKIILKIYEMPVYLLPDITKWNIFEHIAQEVYCRRSR